MAKFDSDTINRWAVMADAWLSKNFGITDQFGITDRSHVVDGSSAWVIAHRVGIVEEAYADRSVVDAHIVTALRVMFPNVVFKDKYSY